MRTGKSEACGARIKETESFQHCGIIADVICDSKHSQHFEKNTSCHHELIALNLIVTFGSIIIVYSVIREKVTHTQLR